jgi:hypothetical protein
MAIDIGKRQTIEELTGGRIRKTVTPKASTPREGKPKRAETRRGSVGKT